MKTAGIIGGIGPFGTLDLFRQILACSKASCDGEHVPLLIDNDTQMTRGLDGSAAGDAAFLFALCRSARRLEAAGADYLAIACNNSYRFYDELCKEVNIPILNMPKLTAAFCAAKGYRRLALLATPGTLRSGVYSAAFSGTGIELLLPEGEMTAALGDVILNGIKAGKETFPTNNMQIELDKLTAAGAEAFILACTELPEAFSRYGLKGHAIDPTQILAESIIENSENSRN